MGSSSHDLVEASVVINGSHFPANKFKMDRSIGDTAEIYQDFLENSGIGIDDREFDISENDYFNGTFLLNFDFSPDLCNRYHRHIPNSGNIDIKESSVVVLFIRVGAGPAVPGKGHP